MIFHTICVRKLIDRDPNKDKRKFGILGVTLHITERFANSNDKLVQEYFSNDGLRDAQIGSILTLCERNEKYTRILTLFGHEV